MAHPLSEHIEYLTLPGRFDLFQSAIEHVIQDGDVVGDLGCGVGVLGLQCLKAGAGTIYGIDSSDAIHLARETMERAGIAGQYHCIAGSTFHTALPEAADLLICDHVGYFGFDYGIVELLRDAAARMLKPAGRIIPDQLRLEVAAVSSDACREKASAWTDPVVPEELRWLDKYSLNSKHRYDFEASELCSDPATLGEIALGEESDKLLRFAADLVIGRDGRFTGIAGWFRAHLGGDIWMTNSPVDPASMGRSQAFLPVEEPFAVKRGDRVQITLRASSDGSQLMWSVQPPGDGPKQKMSTWASTVLNEADLTLRGDAAAQMTQSGERLRYVLSLVDGKRSCTEIEEAVLRERPDLLPTDRAIRDYVRGVLAHQTSP